MSGLVDKMDETPKWSNPTPNTKKENARGGRTTTIKWDEETIALHDLDRGTRQKIDEPDTPYSYGPGAEVIPEDGDVEDMDPSEVQLNMNAVSDLEDTRLEPIQSKIQIIQPDLMDQWHRINATLEYEKQKQEHAVAASPRHVTIDNEDENSKKMHEQSHVGSDPGEGQELESAPPTTTAHPVDHEHEESDFKRKRSAHYNEFHLIQAMKQKHKAKMAKKAVKLQEMHANGLNLDLTVDDLESDSDSD